MEQQPPNGQSYLRKARFVHGQHLATATLEATLQAFDLRRFSGRFASFECDKQARHPLCR